MKHSAWFRYSQTCHTVRHNTSGHRLFTKDFRAGLYSQAISYRIDESCMARRILAIPTNPRKVSCRASYITLANGGWQASYPRLLYSFLLFIPVDSALTFVSHVTLFIQKLLCDSSLSV